MNLLQLTGGQFKGIKLISPTGARSTLSIVRESIFNILSSYFLRCDCNFSGLKFLDAFSGSGIMALEAYSRGFEVVGIEKNKIIAKIAKENFEKLKLKSSIIIGDALKAINKVDENFDVMYLDPPWDMDYGEIIQLSAYKLNKGGVIICESDKTRKIDFVEILPAGFKILKEKTYGRTSLTIISAEES